MKTSVILTVTMITVLSFVGLMQIKNGVQDLRAQRTALLQDKTDLKESIQVLKAEKAYQSREERLSAYASEMDLHPVAARQVLSVSPGLVEMAFVEQR